MHHGAVSPSFVLESVPNFLNLRDTFQWVKHDFIVTVERKGKDVLCFYFV